MKTLRQRQYQYNKRLKKQYNKTNKSISFEQYKTKMKNELIVQKAIQEEIIKGKKAGTYSKENVEHFRKKALKRFEEGGDLATERARNKFFKSKQKMLIGNTNVKRAEERVLYSQNTTLLSQSDVLKHRIINTQMNRESRKRFNSILRENKTSMKDITVKKLDKENVKEISGFSTNEYEVIDNKTGKALGSFRYRNLDYNNDIDPNKNIIDESDEIYQVDEEISEALEDKEDEKREEENTTSKEYDYANKLTFGVYKEDKAFRNQIRELEKQQFN